MRRDKLLEEQLVRLDALYEYAVLEEALQPICENYAQRWSGQGYDQCLEALVEETDLLAIRDAR